MHNFKKRLRGVFKEAELSQPSVILLDDLDHTMPNVADAQEQIGEEGTASIRRTQGKETWPVPWVINHYSTPGLHGKGEGLRGCHSNLSEQARVEQ